MLDVAGVDNVLRPPSSIHPIICPVITQPASHTPTVPQTLSKTSNQRLDIDDPTRGLSSNVTITHLTSLTHDVIDREVCPTEQHSQEIVPSFWSAPMLDTFDPA